MNYIKHLYSTIRMEYSIIPSILITLYLASKTAASKLYSKCLNSIYGVKWVNNDTYEVVYYIDGQFHHILLKRKLALINSNTVLDENGNDVTAILHKYRGPSGDFHNQRYTPRDFGKKKIVTIDNVDGSEIIVDERDVLI